MATELQKQKITSKAIFDKPYRKRLLKNPKKAAEELKIKLSPSEIEYIKSLDPAQLEDLARQVLDITKSNQGVTHWS